MNHGMGRTIEVPLALFGLAVTFPVSIVAAVAIKLEDGGPVFFKQERIGKGGSSFEILKFRTMRVDGAGGLLISANNDSRITRVGALLRKSKLDELPQLFNVLKGEMSLVGPRPEVARYVQHYDERQRRVLEVLPGITDPASIAYIDEGALLARSSQPEETYIREIMPAKLELNLAYLDTRTPASDLMILLKTFGRIFFR